MNAKLAVLCRFEREVDYEGRSFEMDENCKLETTGEPQKEMEELSPTSPEQRYFILLEPYAAN